MRYPYPMKSSQEELKETKVLRDIPQRLASRVMPDRFSQECFKATHDETQNRQPIDT